MGAGHSHRGGPDRHDGFEVARTPQVVLLAALALAALVTVIGGALVWPDGDRARELQEEVSFAAPGVTFPQAEVVEVGPPCEVLGTRDDEGCGQVRATVTGGAFDGDEVTVDVPPEVSEAGLGPGDPIRLTRTPADADRPAGYGFFGIERTTPLLLLTLVFVVVVVAVARLRGLMALVGLVFTGAAILTFMLPALVVGESGLVVALVGASAIVFVVLYSTHGVSIRTSAAVAGTLVGLLMTAAVGAFSVSFTHLTGVADEGSGILRSLVGDLDFQGLMTCAIIVAGLGVLNDVTITQASSVWELRGAAPTASRRQVFLGAMQIGRDHIASTIYTIVFAYAGTALAVLMLLQLYGLPVTDLLATEEIGQEVVRTLVSSIALVLAVPATTAIAAATVPGARPAPAAGSATDGPVGLS